MATGIERRARARLAGSTDRQPDRRHRPDGIPACHRPRHSGQLAGGFRQHRVIREGLIAGLSAAFVVALWFLAIDVTQGRVFFTPAALGSAVFMVRAARPTDKST